MAHYIRFFLISNLIIISLTVSAQSYLPEEGFEHGGSIPFGWSQIKESGSANWIYKDGGLYDEGVSHPEHAYEGSYNALFAYSSSYTTKLITPPINLENALKPALIFWHAMQEWAGDVDELRIYYREHVDSVWILLEEYTTEVYNWTQHIIYLPDTLLSPTAYIAFEGKSAWGAGICIDNVSVVEHGIVPKSLENIYIKSVPTNFIPTSSKNNLILRVDLEVSGNSGEVTLESLNVKSLNTSDDDVNENGVKLFYTEDTIFSPFNQIGTAQNFTNGIAIFNNINQSLPFGYSSVWVCYDIKDDINHEMHGHIADAMILADGISISGVNYPYTDKSPSGERIIYESILHDDFETDKGWSFGGEFQRGTSQGKGAGGYYSPDPSVANSGTNIIGTDLGFDENDGNYLANMVDRQDSAVTPVFNAKYYKDLTLSYYRWLNIQILDDAFIDYSTDNGSSWTNYWESNNFFNDRTWKQINFNMSSVLDRKSEARIRFSLGPSSPSEQAGGWNIDDFVIVGNFISKDVGIINWLAPLSGCGHMGEEYVTVTIKNFAGEPLNEPLPLSYSFDGGNTIYYDTIPNAVIDIDGTFDYQIDKPININYPGWYNNVYATTHLFGDEDISNNRFNKKIFITPTYSLPYSTNFETNYAYWLTGGINSTWEYGTPSGIIIKTAASGSKVWITELNSNYRNNEDSYIESPCFNTINTNKPIIEFKMLSDCEEDNDGLALYYSIDDGASWNIVPQNGTYNWNWYNKSYITALGHEGWDTSYTTWTKVKQILPNDAAGKSSIKLRFIFKSNESTSYEGFAIDDFKMYEAPYDVGVSSLASPFDQCEWSESTQVQVYIENYGPTPVKSGTKIPVVLEFNATVIKDTLTLVSDIAIADSVLFTFGSTVDMSYTGIYNFTLYTQLESDPYFYNDVTCNDSLITAVEVEGMPRYNPFPDLIGDNPVSLTLDAGEESPGIDYSDYDWSTGATTRTLGVNTPGTYSVTVTNSNGCSASDEVEIVESEIDLTMTQLYTELSDSCERNELTTISVQITNNSLKELVAGVDDIDLAYQINNEVPVKQTFTLSSNLPIGNTEDFIFTQQADFRNVDEYTFKVYVDFMNDLNHSDDTITENFNTKGFVDIAFNTDTIFSSNADTLKLAPSPLYSTYLWTPGGSTDDTLDITQNISQWYKAVVSDSFVCGSDSDSVYIETYDMAIINLNSPANRCENNITGSTDINVRIKNYSGNTYNSSTPLKFMYNFNGEGWTEKNMTLGTTLIPNAETNLSIINVDRTIPGEYSVEVYLKSAIDANTSNDSINDIFETYPLPSVDLAFDTIFTTRADTVILVADPGWGTYTWNTGSTNDSLQITSKYSRKYFVDVEDEHACGSASDTTWIVTYNVGVSALTAPKNKCEHSTTESVKIVVKNFSQDTLLTNTIIPVGYIINNNSPVIEDLKLLSDLLPGKTVNFTFTTKANLAAINTYLFKLFTSYSLDVDNSNDTLVEAIKTHGYPTIELGEDIYTTQPETVDIVVDPGYITYWWNEDDGLEDNILNVTYPATKSYSVTVTDINGCSTTDQLTVYTYNIQADSLVSPIAECDPSATETVIIGVSNQSADTLLTGEQLVVGYRLNGNNLVSQNFTLTETLYPDSTELFTLNTYPADLRENINHEFKVFAKLTNIDVETDDTTTIYVDNLKPDFDLGPDVNTGQTQYTIDAGAGYTTYQWFNGSANRTYTVDINDQKPNFYYAVTVTNSFGCQASDSIMVTFDLTPDLQMISISSPVSDCWQSGETYPVQVTLQNVGEINIAAGTPLSIGYRINNGTAVIENVNLSSALNADQTLNHTFASEIDFASAQVYIFKPFVKYSIDADPTNDTLTVSLDISQPDVTFDYDTVYFTTTADIEPIQNFSSYLWSTGATTKRITVSATGTYTVTVTDANGCSGSGKVYCEQIITGIDNIIEGNGYNISYFPNPVSEKLQIQFNNSQSMDVVMEIITPNGQIIYNKLFSKIQNTIERIDVNQFANGIYYIRFRVNDEYFTRKIIIQ